MSIADSRTGATADTSRDPDTERLDLRDRDRDRDGVPDRDELREPRLRDRDHDGVPDRDEPHPSSRDRDHDGVPDRDEPAGRDTTVIERVDGRVDGVEHVDGLVPVAEHRALMAREKREYGGVKIGSAFFGWLTATGTAVLLTALVAAIGTAVGLGTGDTVGEVASDAIRNADTVGPAGAIALLAILFVSYFCGGYVAGRMARFHGARQGFAVWVWALVIAGVVAAVAAATGAQYDVLAKLDSFPRLPVNEGTLTTAGVVTAIAVAVAGLLGAVLGGLAGMHFHRMVDRVAVTPPVVEHEVDKQQTVVRQATA